MPADHADERRYCRETICVNLRDLRARTRARRRSPDLAETTDRRSPWFLETYGQAMCGVGRPAHSAIVAVKQMTKPFVKVVKPTEIPR